MENNKDIHLIGENITNIMHTFSLYDVETGRNIVDAFENFTEFSYNITEWAMEFEKALAKESEPFDEYYDRIDAFAKKKFDEVLNEINRQKNSTLTTRLGILDKKAEADKKAKEDKRNAMFLEIYKYQRWIETRKEKLSEIIDLFNHCVDLGIKLPTSGEAWQYGGYGKGNYGFCANMTYHNVGIMDNHLYGDPIMPEKLKHTDFIGIYEWNDIDLCVNKCGKYSFNWTYLPKDEDKKLQRKRDILKRFCDNFDTFYTCFTQWVDSLAI